MYYKPENEIYTVSPLVMTKNQHGKVFKIWKRRNLKEKKFTFQ